MVLTLRLTDELTAALEAQAAREGRSVQEVVVLAIEARIDADRRATRLDVMFDAVADEDAELLDRLSR